MAEGNNFNRAPLPKTALNEYKLRLTAPPVNGGKKRPSLGFSVVKNQPRITVYTNVESDKSKGMIHAAMDTPTFFSFLQLLQKTIDGEPDTKYCIENKNHTFFNGERSKEPVVVSTTIVGKDREGRVFLAVTGKGITNVKFVFGPSDYHHFVHKDGTPFAEAELSIIYARAYLNMLHNLIPNVLDSHFHDEEKDGGKQGGFNKGGYKGGNRNGGGNNYGGGKKYQGDNSNRSAGGFSDSDDWGGGSDSESSGEEFSDDYFPL